MTLPNFLVIGTPRSGTTSLYEWLQQHPDVFMSPYKEPHYFGCTPEEKTQVRPPGMEFVSDFGEYQALFQEWNGQRAVGEASPAYLDRHLAPAHIKQVIPHVKMIAVFRNPVERAFSSYMLYRSQGLEREADFLTAIRAEQSGKRTGTDQDWNYLGLGYYARQLRHYRAHFPSDQIKTFLFEELTKNSHVVLADICRFLEIDSGFAFDTSTAYNAMYVQKSEALGKALYSEAPWKRLARRVVPQKTITSIGRRLEDWNRVKPQKLTDEARAYLRDIYRSDILEFQDLIGRDLSHWLKPKAKAAGTGQPGRESAAAAASLPAGKHLSPQPSQSPDV